jgi:F0F1-type ATP synthase membrane subunit b/b'
MDENLGFFSQALQLLGAFVAKVKEIVFSLIDQLGVNYTFFIMFALFAVTYLIVSNLLTKPLGALLVERDRRTAGRQEEIVKIRVELTEISEELAKQRREAQGEASLKFAELKNKAVTEQRKILAQAREDFAAQVKTARENAEKMLQTERQKIERLSAELKTDLSEKLLGESSVSKAPLRREI